MALDLLAKKLENFQYAVARDLYEVHTGLRERTCIPDIYREYSYLFNTDQIKNALDKAQTLAKLGDRRYLPVTSALIKEYLISHVQVPQAELAYYRATTKVVINEESMTLRSAQSRMLVESNREIRRQLFNVVGEAVNRVLNPILLQMYRELDELAKNVGNLHYLQLCDEVRVLRLNDFVPEIYNLLDNTYQFYFDSLAKIAQQELNLPVKSLERSDAFELWRLNRFSSYFSHEASTGILHKVLTTLGIDDLFANVRVETRKAEKSVRSFCYPIDIPNEIVLILGLRGRPDDYRILFHEVGHALHLSGIPASIPPWDRRWGDPSLSEAYAFLFENLLMDKKFVSQYLGLHDPEYLNISKTNRLYLIRLFAAKAIWEIKYHNVKDLDIAIQGWASIVTTATGFQNNGTTAFLDREFFLNSVTYLRSWIL
ncbi:oligoendopeptidase [Mesorhizobium sp. M00.F.Ca.ET.186.01.1.1]|nr:oligoendopeptidase [Mesorhizobium sp. M00.F.Ca.ET.186.01.1.1]